MTKLPKEYVQRLQKELEPHELQLRAIRIVREGGATDKGTLLTGEECRALSQIFDANRRYLAGSPEAPLDVTDSRPTQHGAASEEPTQ